MQGKNRLIEILYIANEIKQAINQNNDKECWK